MIPCIALLNVVGRWKSDISSYSLLPLDIDDTECRLLCKFKEVACLPGQEANTAVVFALDQMFTTVIADELYAVARAGVRIFVFTLEGKSLDDNIKADVWLVPVEILLVFH